MTYFEDSFSKIYMGDAREVLKSLPEHSVDMCMTSPPYWDLRKYSGEPSIWDEDKNCQHEWGCTLKHNILGGTHGINPEYNENRKVTMQSNFCLKCGAWRGQLGLEPDPDLYIKHVCDIFDLVRKVMKPTGIIFVNIGDSYAGSWRGKPVGTLFVYFSLASHT